MSYLLFVRVEDKVRHLEPAVSRRREPKLISRLYHKPNW